MKVRRNIIDITCMEGAVSSGVRVWREIVIIELSAGRTSLLISGTVVEIYPHSVSRALRGGNATTSVEGHVVEQC